VLRPTCFSDDIVPGRFEDDQSSELVVVIHVPRISGLAADADADQKPVRSDRIATAAGYGAHETRIGRISPNNL
jgi:hypothetical protein